MLNTCLSCDARYLLSLALALFSFVLLDLSSPLAICDGHVCGVLLGNLHSTICEAGISNSLRMLLQIIFLNVASALPVYLGFRWHFYIEMNAKDARTT